MNIKVLNLLSTYKSWLVTNYKAIVKLNASLPVLRLVSKERNQKSGEIYFIIQIIGKNIFPKLHLNDFKDSSILLNFSKNDQDIILNAIFNKYKACITARTYNRQLKKFIFTIEYQDNNIKRSFTFDEISLLINEMKHFDDEDASLISLDSKKTEFN